MKLPLHMVTCCSVVHRYTKFSVDISKICWDLTQVPVWLLFCWFWLVVPDKRFRKSKRHGITFVRLGLKIIYGHFEEDMTIIVGGVGFQRFLIQPEIAENLYNRKLSPLNVEFVFIQGIQWYLIFENRSNGSKVVYVNKSPTLTRWWR